MQSKQHLCYENMTLQERRKHELIATIEHMLRIESKILSNLGRSHPFAFPDQHKMYEGLFLSAWTHWEEFLRDALINDLAEKPTGVLRRDMKQFRTKGATRRLTERILFSS